jgi:hypothetical protein
MVTVSFVAQTRSFVRKAKKERYVYYRIRVSPEAARVLNLSDKEDVQVSITDFKRWKRKQ